MATRKNFKKTGRKRIKPKGGAKKRKTVRGGMFLFKSSVKVHPTPITAEQWFSQIERVSNDLKTAYKKTGNENTAATSILSDKYNNLKNKFSQTDFQAKINEYLSQLDQTGRSAKEKILEDLDLQLN